MIHAICQIARQEFIRVTFHPVAIVLALLMLIMAFISVDAARILNISITDATIYSTTGGLNWAYTPIFLIMSAFFGAISIPFDRWKHSYNVLLSKPLYRRDIIIGKFVGLTGSMLAFSLVAVLSIALFAVLYLRDPQSIPRYLSWVGEYVLLLGFTCATIIALGLLIGTISKNLLVVTTLAFVYVSIEIFWYADWLFPGLEWLLPKNLSEHVFLSMLMGANYPSYFGGSPLTDSVIRLAIMLIELLFFLGAGICLFVKEDII